MGSLLDDGYMDGDFMLRQERIAKGKQELDRWLGKMSMLFIDPGDDFSVRDIVLDGEAFVYLDLASLRPGDWERFGRRVEQCQKDGKLKGFTFDNVDQAPSLPKGEQEYFQDLVTFALKGDDDVRVGRTLLDFSDIRTVARCKEYPAYLAGKSPYAIIVDLAAPEE